MMKTLGCIVLVGLCLIPIRMGYADNPFLIESGRIGDFSPTSRTYEVKGKMYTFPDGIVIQDRYGNALDFDALQGGTVIDIMAERVYSNGQETVIYKSIIVHRTR